MRKGAVHIIIGRTRLFNIASLIVLLIGVLLVTVALRNIYVSNRGYTAAQDEYDMLRDQFEHMVLPATTGSAANLNNTDYVSEIIQYSPLAGIPAPKLNLAGNSAAFGIFPFSSAARQISPAQNDIKSKPTPIANTSAMQTGLAGSVSAMQTGLADSTPASPQALSSGSPGNRSMFKHFHNIQPSDAPPGPKDINPDYVGWISIAGTSISYPVVRGADNEKYVHETFSGAQNNSGAIFLDYRCKKNFSSPVNIIYGHSMNDGSMFAPIRKYQDFNYIAQFPVITIATEKGDILNYRIFDAKRVSACDGVFSLDMQKVPEAGYFAGAPVGADRFLILSTCIGFTYNDERMLVYAALEK